MECNFPLGPCSQHDPFEFFFRHSTISVLIVTAKSSLKIKKYIMKDFHLICIVLFHYRLSVFTFKKSSFCARDILLVLCSCLRTNWYGLKVSVPLKIQISQYPVFKIAAIMATETSNEDTSLQTPAIFPNTPMEMITSYEGQFTLSM